MESQLSGWDTYPENVLCDEICGCTCDRSQYRVELEEDAQRLFSSTRLDLLVVELGRSDHYFNTLWDLEEYLEKPSSSGSTRVFLIPQAHSWACLSITFEAFQKLCTRLSVFPHFLDVLRLFGEKIVSSDDSYGAFNTRKGVATDTLELSYAVKHVEKHDRQREDPLDRWSFRQTGLYHRLESHGKSEMIVLNPSKSFLQRLRQLNKSGHLKHSWDIETLLLSCSTQQWKWYHADLEKRIIAAKLKAQLAEGGESPSTVYSSNSILQADSVQHIQVLQDNATTLCHYLDINRDLFEQVEKIGLGEHNGGQIIQSLVREMDEQSRRANVTLRRIDSCLSLVKTLLEIRCLESSDSCLQELRINTDAMNTMAASSQPEIRTIYELSGKGSRDAGILQIVTFLGLIYLPAIFVASLMSMGYINLNDNLGKVSLKFDGGFYIFLVITVMLWVITFSAYYLWRSWSQKRMCHKL